MAEQSKRGSQLENGEHGHNGKKARAQAMPNGAIKQEQQEIDEAAEEEEEQEEGEVSQGSGSGAMEEAQINLRFGITLFHCRSCRLPLKPPTFKVPTYGLRLLCSHRRHVIEIGRVLLLLLALAVCVRARDMRQLLQQPRAGVPRRRRLLAVRGGGRVRARRQAALRVRGVRVQELRGLLRGGGPPARMPVGALLVPGPRLRLLQLAGEAGQPLRWRPLLARHGGELREAAQGRPAAAAGLARAGWRGGPARVPSVRVHARRRRRGVAGVREGQRRRGGGGASVQVQALGGGRQQQGERGDDDVHGGELQHVRRRCVLGR